MHHITRTIGLSALVAGMVVAVGCGSGEDKIKEAAEAAQEGAAVAAESAKSAAQEGADAARTAAASARAAADAAAAKGSALVEEGTDVVEEKMGDTAASASPVQTCMDLAGQKAWVKAVEPCTLAAQQRPDDLKIRHALQQAKAGALDAARSAIQ